MKIEILIFPTVTDMAGHTAFLITLGANAEVVDLVLLTDSDRIIPPGNLEWSAFPGPVGGLHHIVGCILMAFQTGFGYFLTGYEWTLDDIKSLLWHMDDIWGF